MATLSAIELLNALRSTRRVPGYSLADWQELALRTRSQFDLEYNRGQAAVLYEIGMDFYHLGKWFEAYINLQESVHCARKGLDDIGRLYASMNISGLILPQLGMWKQGFDDSRLVALEAANIAADATDKSERSHALHIQASTLCQRIRMVARCARGDFSDEMLSLVTSLKAMPNFDTFEKDQDVAKDLAVADAYIARFKK